jgi:hypothetical protein
MVFLVGDESVSSEVGENALMEFPVVMGWTLVSAMTRIRLGTL